MTSERETNRLGADGAVCLSHPENLLKGGDVSFGFSPIVGGGSEGRDKIGEDMNRHCNHLQTGEEKAKNWFWGCRQNPGRFHRDRHSWPTLAAQGRGRVANQSE